MDTAFHSESAKTASGPQVGGFTHEGHSHAASRTLHRESSELHLEGSSAAARPQKHKQGFLFSPSSRRLVVSMEERLFLMTLLRPFQHAR